MEKDMNGMTSKRILIIAVLLLAIPTSYAEAATISKCKQADGSYTFSDTGCNGAKLIERKVMVKTQQNQPAGTTNQGKAAGCSQAEKQLATSHFNKAEEINNSHAEGYDARKDRKRKYQHEMTVGRSILAACSGVAMPDSERGTIRCNSSTQYMSGASFGTTTCK